ncbi:DUF3822 family protein [Persicitalea sp.]|uniref:DUF3822 family protein n=1 Tax=Persicitalea sp. TaxID=3100273 RepID=UPI0035941084
MSTDLPILETVGKSLLPTVKVADPDFDIKSIAQCTLCIEIDESRFRFCFVQANSMRCLWLEDYAFDTFLNEEEYLDKLKIIADEHPFLTSDQWKDVRVSVNTHDFTLIPTALFRREYAGEYLQLATGSEALDKNRVMSHLLPYVNAHTIFTIPTQWSDWLLGLFPLQHIEFYHLSSPMIIGTIVSHSEYREQKLVTIHMEENYFTLIYSDDKKLKFCNRFQYQSPLELTYLVLFSMNQLEVLPDEIKAKLYGEITPFSDVYIELAKFLPSLQFGNNPTTLAYTNGFEDIPEHRYFGLLNTYLVQS